MPTKRMRKHNGQVGHLPYQVSDRKGQPFVPTIVVLKLIRTVVSMLRPLRRRELHSRQLKTVAERKFEV